MISRVLSKNKKKFIQYNNFRKKVFAELSPKDSEYIFYLLPWLLSINHKNCPGFVSGLKKNFRVFNIDNEAEIRKREPVFKRMFNIKEKGTLLKPPEEFCWIQGLYTIGSVGTVSHTSSSDCDIWICYDKDDFDNKSFSQFNYKINLIKDWLDLNIKLPVYFFLSHVKDIRRGNFGSVDSESSGSTQKNVLKEEFYRTCIVIIGKIPLWWLAYEKDKPLDYNQALLAMHSTEYGDYDLIDFGNLEKIEPSEHFGAALWQFQKSLTRPLKSIIKMLLLKHHLDARDEKLICHQFRHEILYDEKQAFKDPVVYTMNLIFEDYSGSKNRKVLSFIQECFYLRCRFRSYYRNQPLKKQLTAAFFKEYPMDKSVRTRLNNFMDWDLNSQIDLGNRLFQFMLKIYREISSAHVGIASRVDKQDMTILGRRIHSCYQQKPDKVQIIPKPEDWVNLPNLTIALERKTWKVFAGANRSKPVVSNTDIIYNIAFIIWNNLFEENHLFMEPNPSPVTVQEIMNLCRQIRDFFGTNDMFSVDNSSYLQKEHMTKIMVVVSFEKNPWEKNINDLSVICKNSWGELYVKHFNSPKKLDMFLRKMGDHRLDIEINLYLQRNCSYYEKIIERTKKIISPSLIASR